MSIVTSKIKILDSRTLCILSCIRYSKSRSGVLPPKSINIVTDKEISVPVEMGLELISAQIPGSKYVVTIYDPDSVNNVYEVLVSIDSSVPVSRSYLVSIWLLDQDFSDLIGNSQIFSEVIIDLLCKYPIPTHLMPIRYDSYQGSISIRITEIDFTKYSQISSEFDYIWSMPYIPKIYSDRWWNPVKGKRQRDSDPSESRYLLQIPRMSKYPDNIRKVIWEYAGQIISNETNL